MLIKQEVLQQLIAKEVLKTKMINVAGQMFSHFEKVFDVDNIKLNG